MTLDEQELKGSRFDTVTGLPLQQVEKDRTGATFDAGTCCGAAHTR